MDLTINDIINYFIILEKKFGFNISFHSFSCKSFIDKYVKEIGKYNSHCSPYCTYIKSIPELRHNCICQQEQLIKQCGDEVSYKMAFCGLEQYVIPIRKNNTTLGFISVSGYHTENGQSADKIQKLCDEYDLNADEFAQLVASLSSTKPKLQEIVALLKIASANLADLMYDYYNGNDASKAEINIYPEIITYIMLNYTNKMSVKEISEYCHCSESYINHTFKKNNGLGISQYVNTLRIKKAKKLLIHTDYAISEIAYMTGFCEANYFTNIFKKYSGGISPKEYRKLNGDFNKK